MLTAASLMVSGAGRRRCGGAAPNPCRPCASACIWCWWKASRCCRRLRCPTWSMARGISAPTWRGPARRCFSCPGCGRQLAAEIEAQFAAFAATGLALDHVNSHKHFHLHPTIAALMVTHRRSAWRQRRAGAAGAASGAGADREASSSWRGGADRALRPPPAPPLCPRRHGRARSGVRAGLVGRHGRRRGSRA